MRNWTPQHIADVTGARLVAPPTASQGPRGVAIDSRSVAAGDLFVGLPGERDDGGAFAGPALAAGAWGVLATPAHVDAARCAVPGVLLASDDPLRALGRLATAWRRELACVVVGVTGSTGKTSTKDILAALLAPHRRTVSSHANLNTDIGLPLAVLGARPGTEVLVLEMAMLEAGHIAELSMLAEPDVGVIVNVGPVHLEQLGTLEAIAAAKAELIAALPPGGTAVLPAGEALLERHVRADVATVRFGEGGDVRLVREDVGHVSIQAGAERIELDVAFTQAHLRRNLLAAVAAARAIGVTPRGRVEPEFSALRGERVVLPGELVLINDCYNANPMSMRAALDDLAATPADRRVAVLGDMLELGAGERQFHADVGRFAGESGVDLLVAVGPRSAAMADAFPGESHLVADASEAAALAGDLLAPGDAVLVKASRGVGLELVAEMLAAAAKAAR
ncbi:MAG: UDP-N-acetylmuramoyl-tripeptide--D-alanyl-D-alanine ligase [Actinomycetota bacterium]|nr:UDP-N-acetylmuramoyl-tripeptide--D-alanyl-D-alanine ligase [Actinomycetota bacterium]